MFLALGREFQQQALSISGQVCDKKEKLGKELYPKSWKMREK